MEYSPQPVFYFCYYSSLSRKRAIVTEEVGGGRGEEEEKGEKLSRFLDIPEKALDPSSGPGRGPGKPVNQILTHFLSLY